MLKPWRQTVPIKRANRYDQDELLVEFWRRAPSRQLRLMLLRDFSKVMVGSLKHYRNRRKARLARQLRVWEYQCFICTGKADVMHHIIQLCNGGSNSRWNLVPLCDSCHRDVHPWMPLEATSIASTFWS
jgi:5-methylcytosine-specific restriction endonuclease McrA